MYIEIQLSIHQHIALINIVKNVFKHFYPTDYTVYYRAWVCENRDIVDNPRAIISKVQLEMIYDTIVYAVDIRISEAFDLCTYFAEQILRLNDSILLFINEHKKNYDELYLSIDGRIRARTSNNT